MERLIDADELKDIVEYACDEDGSEEALKWCNWFKEVINAEYNRQQKKVKPIEASPLISKADYITRLKSDMVAMLEELKLEFEEYEPKWAENEDQAVASNRTWDDFDDIIRQKIDKLKEQQGENKNE